jgi:hypothetical protein
MLLYPLLDKSWRYPVIQHQSINFAYWFFITILLGLLLLSDVISIKLTLLSLLLAAVPEEWFFRAYFQTRLHDYLKNNHVIFKNHPALISIAITSVLFASVHAVMQNNLFLLPLMFFPSVLFGYLYYITRDIILVALTHLASNMILLWIMEYDVFFSHLLKNILSTTP